MAPLGKKKRLAVRVGTPLGPATDQLCSPVTGPELWGDRIKQTTDRKVGRAGHVMPMSSPLPFWHAALLLSPHMRWNKISLYVSKWICCECVCVFQIKWTFIFIFEFCFIHSDYRHQNSQGALGGTLSRFVHQRWESQWVKSSGLLGVRVRRVVVWQVDTFLRWCRRTRAIPPVAVGRLCLWLVGADSAGPARAPSCCVLSLWDSELEPSHSPTPFFLFWRYFELTVPFSLTLFSSSLHIRFSTLFLVMKYFQPIFHFLEVHLPLILDEIWAFLYFWLWFLSIWWLLILKYIFFINHGIVRYSSGLICRRICFYSNE